MNTPVSRSSSLPEHLPGIHFGVVNMNKEIKFYTPIDDVLFLPYYMMITQDEDKLRIDGDQ